MNGGTSSLTGILANLWLPKMFEYGFKITLFILACNLNIVFVRSGIIFFIYILYVFYTMHAATDQSDTTVEKSESRQISPQQPPVLFSPHIIHYSCWSCW
jgi:hypothetical protein